MDFPKKQAQRLMPLYLLEYSEKLFTNHPDPSAPWGGGGGSDYTAGDGIIITNDVISVDDTIAKKSDIPSLTGYATEEWVQNQNYMKNDDPTWSSIFKGPTVYVGLGGTYGYTVYAEDRIVNWGGLNGSDYEYIFPTKSGTFALTSDIITSYNDLTDKPELPDFTTYYYLNNEFQSGGYKTTIRDYGLEYSKEWEENKITLNLNTAELENNASIVVQNNGGKKVAISNRIDVFNDPNSGVSVEGEKVAIHSQNQHTTSLQDGKLTYEDGLWKEFNLPTTKDPGTYTLATTQDIPSLEGYATETWVQNQGYITNAALNNYVTTTQLSTTLSDYALKSDIPSLDGYATQTWVENKGYATSSSLATVSTTGSYNDLTDKPSIPTTATSTSTSTVTPTTGTFVTGTSTNTANVVNSVTYTPSAETLTFTYDDNTTASFTFLTSSTTITSDTTSVVTSVTDSTSNAMTGATVSTSTTTTLS